MNLSLLILIPLLTAVAVLLMRNAAQVRWVSLLGASAQLVLAFVLLFLGKGVVQIRTCRISGVWDVGCDDR